MAGRQARALPKSMRNPIDALEMASILKDAAEDMEKTAQQEGRSERARPTVLRVYSFANELKEWANEKIGDHEARIKK